MSVLNMVSVLTATVGTGAITLGNAVTGTGANYVTDVQAGAVDQKTYHAHVQENADFMLVSGTYTASGRLFTVNKVLISEIGGTVGTTQMMLAGAAVVTFVSLAEDFQELTGVRDVTATADAIVNADGGGLVTYNNAGAVAVTLAQATGLNFKKGWFAFLKNKGAGTVTITPTTSTIDNATLKQNQSMLLYSDGSNFFSILFRNDASTIGNAVLTAPDVGTAQAALGIYKSVDIASTDLNTLITGGMFFIEVNCTNQPVAATSYYLLVQKYPQGAGYVQQTAWDLTPSGGMWRRNQVAGSWSAWVRVDAIKALINFTSTTGALVLNQAFNCTAVRNSAGNYTINFTTPFSSNFYTCGWSILFTTGGHAQFMRISAMSASSITVLTLDTTFNLAEVDTLTLQFA